MAVLTCTYNLCFEQKKEKYHIFSSENLCFYSREKSLNISWACFRNGWAVAAQLIPFVLAYMLKASFLMAGLIFILAVINKALDYGVPAGSKVHF